MPKSPRVVIEHNVPNAIRMLPFCRLAEAFAVTPATLKRFAAAYDFPRVFVLGPSRRYVREADVVAWIERQMAAEQQAVSREKLQAFAEKSRGRKVLRGSPTKRGFVREEAALARMIAKHDDGPS